MPGSIDLDPSGVTANDAGDGDTGLNNLQNFPVITDAFASDGRFRVEGQPSTSPGTYRVEVFMSSTCDGSGNGEGKVFVGATSVTVGGATAPISAAFSGSPEGNPTVTATDPAGNTSPEFSPRSRSAAPRPSRSPLRGPRLRHARRKRAARFDELTAGSSGGGVRHASAPPRRRRRRDARGVHDRDLQETSPRRTRRSRYRTPSRARAIRSPR